MYCHISIFIRFYCFVCMGYVMGEVLLAITLDTVGGIHTVLTVRSDKTYELFTLPIEYLQRKLY